MGELALKGSKEYLIRMKRHLEEEHPSTRGKMEVRNPTSELWIKEAISKPGSLRATAKRRYGKEAFKDGMKVEYVRKMAKEKGITGRRARLALTLRKLRCTCKRTGISKCPVHKRLKGLVR